MAIQCGIHVEEGRNEDKWEDNIQYKEKSQCHDPNMSLIPEILLSRKQGNPSIYHRMHSIIIFGGLG
jgi:hypothetical protein